MIHLTHTNGSHAMTTQTTWSVCHAKTSCKCAIRIYIIRTTEGGPYLSYNRFVLLERTAKRHSERQVWIAVYVMSRGQETWEDGLAVD